MYYTTYYYLNVKFQPNDPRLVPMKADTFVVLNVLRFNEVSKAIERYQIRQYFTYVLFLSSNATK